MAFLPPVVFAFADVTSAPPSAVWRWITDWDRQPQWMEEMKQVEITSPTTEGVGVEGWATIRMGGITTRDPVRVVAWEPARRLGLAHLGWVKGSDVFTLEPLTDGGTAIRWVQRLTPPLGLLGAIGLRLFAPLMRRTFARDLRRLAKLAAEED